MSSENQETSFFRVIFSGKIRAEAKPEEVRIKIARLFNLNPENNDHKAKLSRLFSGRPVVIKQGITQEKALKYQQALDTSDAISTIEPMQDSEIASNAPGGVENRKDQRRKIADRRSVRRSSSILPDRRSGKDRRDEDS